MKTRLAAVVAALLLVGCGTGRQAVNGPGGGSDSIGLKDISSRADGAGGETVLPGDAALPEDVVPPEDGAGPGDIAVAELPQTQDVVIPPDIVLPPDCCWTDADCWDSAVCVDNKVPGQPGYCDIAPGPGECYYDDECDNGEVCLGAGICGCGLDCMWSGPGKCGPPVPPPCCQADEHCPGDDICVGGDMGAGGICFPPPTPGVCFGEEHCPDSYFCFGETVCSCDMNCISEPGACHPIGGNCCFGDQECEAGKVCVFLSPIFEDPGVCEPPPLVQGQCWLDSDCGADEKCEGQMVCPCDADCDMVDSFGTCKPDFPGCCDKDEDCLGAEVCVESEFGPASCGPAPAFGECYDDDDCYMIQTCVGSTFCPCNALCSAPTAPGNCTPLPPGCCYTDADCSDDTLCKATGPADGMPGSCVPDPAKLIGCPYPNGCCWDDKDCGPAKECLEAYVCGCIELCPVCGDCMPDQMGHCEYLPD